MLGYGMDTVRRNEECIGVNVILLSENGHLNVYYGGYM
jgi:hypothetical protein